MATERTVAVPPVERVMAWMREPEPVRTVTGLYHRDCLHPLPPVELHPTSSADNVARIHAAERAACPVCSRRAA